MPVSNFHLTNFMSSIKEGARPNQFLVDIALPNDLQSQIADAVAAEDKIRFHCKAASLPASEIGQATIYFRGAEFKLAGDRVYGDWTVTIVNDIDFQIRDAFEQWMDLVVGNVNFDQPDSEQGQTRYMGTGEVNQLSRSGEIAKTYNIMSIWPKNLSEITVDMGSNDVVEEYTVTFAVHGWQSNTTRNNFDIIL